VALHSQDGWIGDSCGVSPTVAARAAYVAFYGAIGASIPYLAVYYGSLGFGLDAVGLLSSLAAAVGLVSAPLWGATADRFAGSRLVLPAAAVLAAVGALGLALLREPILIAVAVAIMAVGTAGVSPILDARALETVRGDRDRYGRLRAWGSAAFIVVVVLTGILVERNGIGIMFIAYLPALLVTALVAFPLPGESASGAPLPSLAGIGVVLRVPDLRRFLLAAILVWSATMAITWFFSVHLLDLGAPGVLVGASWALGAAVEIPIMWFFPILAARFGTERLLIVGAALFAIRALILSVVGDPLPAMLTMLINGAGFSLMLVGGVTYVSRLAPPGLAATAQGVLSAVVFSLAVVVGPGIGGLVAGVWGLQPMFLLAALASFAGIALMAPVVTRRSAAAEPVPVADSQVPLSTRR
jgi:PPP family 3-phenylpropionic acid transporter